MPTPSVRPDETPGIAQAGEAIESLGQQAFKLSMDARERADSLRVDRALLDFNRIRGQLSYGENGVRLRQGENALDFSEDLEALRSAAGEIEAGLSQRQRDLFRQRATPMFDQTALEWERHSAKQFQRVFSETADGLTQQALERAGFAETPEDAERELATVLWEPDPNDPENLRPGVFVRNLTQILGLPPERVQQLIDSLRRDAHVLALNRLLEEGRAEEARAYFEKIDGFLGEKGRAVRRSIRAEEEKLFAASKTSEIIDSASDPEEGFVNEALAWEEFEKLSPRDRERIRPVLRAALVDADRRKQARISEVYNRVYAAYSQGGLRAIDAKDMAWLDEHASHLSGRLREDARRRWEARRVSDAELRRYQADQNTIAKNEFLALPLEERASADLVVMFGGRVDELGMSALQVEQRKAIDAVEKGEATRETQFRTEGLAQAEGILRGSKTRRREFTAALNFAWGDFRREKGRPPDAMEAQEIYDFLITRQVGRQFGYQVLIRRQEAAAKSRSEGAIDVGAVLPYRQGAVASTRESRPPAPGQSSKRIVRYLVSPDGTRRVPVYEDGTFGEEQIVR